MDRNDRNILILGILVLVLLAVGYYFLLLSPLRGRYADAVEEQSQKEAWRQQLEQTANQLDAVRRDAPDIERTILELSKRLPEQDEIPTLVVQIQEIAEGARVTQLLIEPGSPEAPPEGSSGDFSRIPINMSFEGTYAQMQDFLLRLRNLARLVTVNEVTFEKPDDGQGKQGGGTTARGGGTTAGGGGGGNDLLTVRIAAETYVQPAATEGTNAAPGGGTAPATPPGAGKASGKAGAKAGGKAK